MRREEKRRKQKRRKKEERRKKKEGETYMSQKDKFQVLHVSVAAARE